MVLTRSQLENLSKKELIDMLISAEDIFKAIGSHQSFR